MKKTLYILILFFMCFFINFDKVDAEAIEAGELLYTCKYSASNGKFQANYHVYRQEYSFSTNSYYIEVTKWDDGSVHKLPNDATYNGKDRQKTMLKNACPLYLLIETRGFGFKVQGYAYSKEAADNAKAKNNNEGVLLTLKNDPKTYFTMLQKIRRGSTTTISKYAVMANCGDGAWGIPDNCLLPETLYNCTYNINANKTMNLPFNETFFVGMREMKDTFGSYTMDNFNANYIYTAYCPTVVYEIVYDNETKDDKTDDQTAYTHNISGWPAICDKSGYTCYRYKHKTTQREVYAKNDKPAVKDAGPVLGKYHYESGIFAQEDKIIELNIKGKTDGTISELSFTVEGNPAYIAVKQENANLEALKKTLSEKADLPKIFQCDKGLDSGSVLVAYDSDLKMVTADAKHKAASDFKGYYCEYTEVASGFKRNYYKYYDSNNLSSTTDGKLEESIKSEIEKVESGSFNKDELYKNAKEIYKKCKERLGSLGVSESDALYTACVDFIDNKIPDWASKGYFGDNVIIGGSGSTDCATTLGSLTEWLKKIYNVVLLAVPVIIVILGFKDFIRALVNGKEDELKKSGSTFIKRLIFGAVFVALPVLISFVIGLALGDGFADICIM